MEKSDSFFIISLVEDKEKSILGVKKTLPIDFLSLFGINSNIGSIWFPPSGFPFKGESRELASERIVYEETGYKVKSLRSIEGTLTTTYIQSTQKAFMKIVILCELTSQKQDTNWRKPEYIEEVKWINKKDLLKYTLPQIVEKWPESLRKILVSS